MRGTDSALPTRILTSSLLIVLAVGLSVAAGHRLAEVLSQAYVVLVFLVAVQIVAVASGLWTAIATAIVSFFAFNFFFVEPTWTLTVADTREVFALGAFLVAAILTGGLAGRLREVADAAQRRADTLAILHDFAERISGTSDAEVIRELLVRRAAERIHGAAVVFDRRGAATGRATAYPRSTEFTTDERRTVLRVFETARPAPAAAPGYSERRFEFRPLIGPDGVVAVVGLSPGSGDRRVTSEDEQGLSALLDQAATALERARLAEESAAAGAAAETERLRSALLSSISHDLRTPLATILGSVTSLRELGDRMEPADRADLLAAIEEETDRLSRFVADLLVMTRLEAGLDPRRDWVDVADVARAAADHIGRVHAGRAPRLDLASALPLVRGDTTLLEQVVFNLLDNAVKASPADGAISLTTAVAGGMVEIAVADRGRGLSPEEIDRLFRRPSAEDRVLAPEMRGGLGLAIARRVVAAMNGELVAESPHAGGPGTRVTVRLPIERAELPSESEEA